MMQTQPITTSDVAVRRSRRDQQQPLAATINDTSRIMGLGRTKIYELIAQDKLKSVAVGRRRLVLYSSIQELLGVAA